MEASALIDRHRPDWIVTCGDMLPDFQQRPPNSRLRAQQEYWRDHRDLFIREGAITTMIVGNHELPGFRFPGMNSLPPGFEDRVVKLERIPREFGPFSFVHGLPEDELAEDLQDQLRLRPYRSTPLLTTHQDTNRLFCLLFLSKRRSKNIPPPLTPTPLKPLRSETPHHSSSPHLPATLRYRTPENHPRQTKRYPRSDAIRYHYSVKEALPLPACAQHSG